MRQSTILSPCSPAGRGNPSTWTLSSERPASTSPCSVRAVLEGAARPSDEAEANLRSHFGSSRGPKSRLSSPLPTSPWFRPRLPWALMTKRLVKTRQRSTRRTRGSSDRSGYSGNSRSPSRSPPRTPRAEREAGRARASVTRPLGLKNTCNEIVARVLNFSISLAIHKICARSQRGFIGGR